MTREEIYKKVQERCEPRLEWSLRGHQNENLLPPQHLMKHLRQQNEPGKQIAEKVVPVLCQLNVPRQKRKK